MEAKIHKFYPMKVWLTTLFTSPLVIIPVNLLENESAFNDGLPAFFQHYIGYSAMGILFSAPALVVYYAAFVQLTKRRLSIPLVKLVIAAIAVLSIPVTMRVVGIDVARLEVMYLPLTYMAVVAITSFVYKLKASPTEDPTLKSAATH